MTDGQHFNNISLGGRGGGNPGQFKLYTGGLAWKKRGGGKIIEVDKSDITSVTWMRIPKSYQLSVGTKEGLCYRFFGFREQVILVAVPCHGAILASISTLLRSIWPLLAFGASSATA